jgi:hypothetical protein
MWVVFCCGWVNQKLGQYFSADQPQNEQAVVYLYRPDSRWNRKKLLPTYLLMEIDSKFIT